MNLSITPPEDILTELRAIDSFLNITCSEEIEEVVNRGNELAVWIARSGKLLADSKYHLDKKMKSEVIETLREQARSQKVSSTAINKIIGSLCAEEQYLVNWSERINRSCVHSMDWCRTLISKAKEEMKFSGMYNNSKF
jgi:hypothetical protein